MESLRIKKNISLQACISFLNCMQLLQNNSNNDKGKDTYILTCNFQNIFVTFKNHVQLIFPWSITEVSSENSIKTASNLLPLFQMIQNVVWNVYVWLIKKGRLIQYCFGWYLQSSKRTYDDLWNFPHNNNIPCITDFGVVVKLVVVDSP